jgi:hydroxyacylglutathione hydrolase
MNDRLRSDQNFPLLERGFFKIGLEVRDINLLINFHEHCDYVGANRYLHEWVHLWLENMTGIDLGNNYLRVFHTPGILRAASLS